MKFDSDYRKRRLLFLGYNFYPEKTGIGKYSGEMVEWLANRGHECTVITSYPYYPEWKVQKPYRKKRWRYSVSSKSFESGGILKIIRCPMYIPSKPSGTKRMLLDLSFLLSMTLPMLAQLLRKKYFAVIAITPSMLVGIPASLYRLIRGSRFIYHIQDLQVEAAVNLGLIRFKWAIKVLFRIEKILMKAADVVSTISEEMAVLIVEKVGKPVYLLPNWANLTGFFPMIPRGELKIKFGFMENDQVILYSGAIGEKQGLESILDAADHFRSDNSIKFAICGSGPYKDVLIHKARKRELQNVFFFDLQPLDRFNEFLNMADVHLVIQKAGAGDLVMPSKLTTILAVGGYCIITANDGTELHKISNQWNLAKTVPAENQPALNNAINLAFGDTQFEIRANARKYAEQFLAIDSILSRFEKELLSDALQWRGVINLSR